MIWRQIFLCNKLLFQPVGDFFTNNKRTDQLLIIIGSWAMELDRQKYDLFYVHVYLRVI